MKKAFLDDENIMKIKKVIKSYGADRIILFGSRVKHLENKFSDYDTLAIFNKSFNHKEKINLETKIRKELAKDFVDIDILVRTKSDIEIAETKIGSTTKNALQEGIEL